MLGYAVVIGRRLKRKSERRQARRRVARAVQFIRELFLSDPPADRWLEPPVGGVGVREPRRPLLPTLSGAAVLEAPPQEMRDVWAVADEDRG